MHFIVMIFSEPVITFTSPVVFLSAISASISTIHSFNHVLIVLSLLV